MPKIVPDNVFTGRPLPTPLNSESYAKTEPVATPAAPPSAADMMNRIETVIRACEAIHRENGKVLSDSLALRVEIPLDLRSCMAQLGVVLVHTRVAYSYFRGVQGLEERERLMQHLRNTYQLGDFRAAD